MDYWFLRKRQIDCSTTTHPVLAQGSMHFDICHKVLMRMMGKCARVYNDMNKTIFNILEILYNVRNHEIRVVNPIV